MPLLLIIDALASIKCHHSIALMRACIRRQVECVYTIIIAIRRSSRRFQWWWHVMAHNLCVGLRSDFTKIKVIILRGTRGVRNMRAPNCNCYAPSGFFSALAQARRHVFVKHRCVSNERFVRARARALLVTFEFAAPKNDILKWFCLNVCTHMSAWWFRANASNSRVRACVCACATIALKVLADCYDFAEMFEWVSRFHLIPRVREITLRRPFTVACDFA